MNALLKNPEQASSTKMGSCEAPNGDGGTETNAAADARLSVVVGVMNVAQNGTIFKVTTTKNGTILNELGHRRETHDHDTEPETQAHTHAASNSSGAEKGVGQQDLIDNVAELDETKNGSNPDDCPWFYLILVMWAVASGE